MVSGYTIRVYSNGEMLPVEAEELFKNELADSRRPRINANQWRYLNLCAVDRSGRVLGGAHLDVGPMDFGPLATDRVAYLENLFIFPEHRRQRMGTALLLRAVEEAGRTGCNHVRCNVSWENPAAIATYRNAGFALTCLEEGYYFAVKPAGM